jgi:hypothetical protein
MFHILNNKGKYYKYDNKNGFIADENLTNKFVLMKKNEWELILKFDQYILIRKDKTNIFYIYNKNVNNIESIKCDDKFITNLDIELFNHSDVDLTTLSLGCIYAAIQIAKVYPKYIHLFIKHRIEYSHLYLLKYSILRDMGIKRMGEILSILDITLK